MLVGDTGIEPVTPDRRFRRCAPAPIYARIETATTNGMFRSSFVGARALVPMIGYYEWEALLDGK